MLGELSTTTHSRRRRAFGTMHGPDFRAAITIVRDRAVPARLLDNEPLLELQRSPRKGAPQIILVQCARGRLSLLS